MHVFGHWNSRVIGPGNFRLFEVNGGPMDAAVFSQRANHPIIAVFSDLGKRVDPAWLSIYKPGGLIVYVKPEAMSGGYGHGHGVLPMAAPANYHEARID
jgi:hypothetical protein